MDFEKVIAWLMGQNRDEVVKQLQTNGQPIFQAVFDRGHSEATTRFTEKKTELETANATLKAEFDKATAKITELSKTNPDVAALQTKHEETVRTLQTTHQAEVLKERNTVTEERRGRKLDELKATLVTMADRDWVDTQMGRPEVVSRFKPNAKGEFEVVRPNSDIPVIPGENKTAIEVLAEEIVEKAPPKFKLSRVDRGSQIVTGGGTGTGGSKFEKIRAEAKARQEARGNSEVPLETRIGMQSKTR